MNPKINNMLPAYKSASHNLLWISDSNVKGTGTDVNLLKASPKIIMSLYSNLDVFTRNNKTKQNYCKSEVKGTQSRIPYTRLSGESAINKLVLLLPSRSCPPSFTSRNTTARHTVFSVFTSLHLLHCTISLASCLFSATLFQVSVR